MGVLPQEHKDNLNGRTDPVEPMVRSRAYPFAIVSTSRFDIVRIRVRSDFTFRSDAQSARMSFRDFVFAM